MQDKVLTQFPPLMQLVSCSSQFSLKKLMSITIWKPNGEKCPVTNVVDGNVFLFVYKEEGTGTSHLQGRRTSLGLPPLTTPKP